MLIPLISMGIYSDAQNIILKCDFQDAGHQCTFTSSTLDTYEEVLDATSWWQTCASPLKFEGGSVLTNMTSPDLNFGDCATNRISTIGGTKRFPVGTISSDVFAGLVCSDEWREGIIIPISGSFTKDRWITYSLKFKASFNDMGSATTSGGLSTATHRFRVLFTKWNENWNASSNNNLMWELPIENFTIPIGVDNGWHEFTYHFTIPEHIDPNEMKNLVIQGLPPNDDNSGLSNYQYIDDIEITELDACESMCLSENGRSNISLKNITGSTTMIDVNNDNILANFDGTQRGSFDLLITNAMYYKVKIYDRWGGQQYEYESKDLNILEEEISIFGRNMPDSSVFSWFGTSQDGTPLSNAGDNQMYIIMIEARNCGEGNVRYVSTSLAFQHLTNTSNFTDIRPENFVDSLANCCPEILEVDNYTYTASVRESRNNYIHSGLNGPVTVSSGTFVQYNAGNEIKLGAGFSVAPGGKFESNIRDCELNHYVHWKRTPVSNSGFINNSREPLSLETAFDGIQGYLIYPNPVKSELTIYTSDNVSSFTIFDMYGRNIQSGLLNLGTNSINVSAYRKGSYTIKINDSYVKKIIKY